MQGHSEKEKLLWLVMAEASLKVTGENEVTRQRGKQAQIPLLDLLVPFISALLGHTAHKGLFLS